MVRRIITWIVVADGARARVFLNEGVGKGVRELSDCAFVSPQLRNRDIQADRPGRTFDRAGHGRHAMEPPTDPQDVIEQRFLREVAVWLDEQRHRGAFDRLVVIAEPRALGVLRRAMPKPLAGTVIAEIPSDLTKAAPAELEQRLGAVMAA